MTLVHRRGHGPVRCPNSCWSPALRRKRDRLKPGLQRTVPTRRRHLDLNHASICWKSITLTPPRFPDPGRPQRTFRQPPDPGMTTPSSGCSASQTTNAPRSSSEISVSSTGQRYPAWPTSHVSGAPQRVIASHRSSAAGCDLAQLAEGYLLKTLFKNRSVRNVPEEGSA